MTATASKTERTAVSEVRGALGMGTRVRRHVVPLHPRSDASGRIRDVAKALSIGEASAEKALYGEHSRARDMARMLEALIKRGDEQLAGELFDVVESPMLGRAVPPLDKAHRDHAVADEREDLHRAECGPDLSDDELDVRIKLLAAEVVRGEILLVALRKEKDERKEARR